MNEIRVSPEFKADFELVHVAFKTSPEEIEESKAIARRSLEAAITSYAEMARLIRGGWKPCGEFTKPQ